MPYVFSTLANSQNYCIYKEPEPKQFTIEKIKSVFIKGGSGMVHKRTLHTPLGVATKVTDEELAFLEAHPSFQKHLKAGHVSFRKVEAAPEKIAADMTTREKSSPIVPQDFKKTDLAKPMEKEEKKEDKKKGK